MRLGSDRFAAALNVSHKRVTIATVTPPHGDPVPLTFNPGATVTSSNGDGARYQASVSVAPRPGTDLFEIIKTPGAYFDIHHGIDFGGGDVEVYPVFHGQVSASATVPFYGGDIPLSLMDDWQRVERDKFLVPTGFTVGYRPILIENAMVGAVPEQAGLVVNRSARGNGPLISGQTGLWDRSRTDAMTQLAMDGVLDIYFDPTGTFIIRDEPVLDPTAPVWTYKSGPLGNIKTADRTRPFDRLYNTVVVRPADESQTWAQTIVQISDPANPRHPDQPGVGVIPFFYSSPTITNGVEALATANLILQRLQNTTETIAITALGNPLQEVGDTVTVLHQATTTDPGVADAYIVDGFTLHLDTGDMELAARSSSVADYEEV